MSVFRKLLSLLAFLLLAGCAMFLLGEKRALSLASVIRNGWDDTRYEAVSAGAGDVWAAASLTGGDLRLVCFSPQGEKLSERSVALPDEDGGTVAALYCAQKDLLFAAVYDLDAYYLSFYRLPEGEEPALLFREPCGGASYDRRRNATRVLGVSQDGDRISVALTQNGALRSYSCSARSGGARQNVIPEAALGFPEGETLSAAVLSDGALALGGNGALLINGRQTSAAAPGQLVTRLTRRNVGLYFLDAASLTVWHSNLSGTESRQLADISAALKGHCVTDLSIGASGESLLLLDGKTLVVVGEDGSRELRDVLYPSRASCAGFFAVYAITALGVVLLVWYALSQIQLALAFYWGAVVMAALLAAILILKHAAIRPAEERLSLESNRGATEAVVRLALRERPLDDPYLRDEISQVLDLENRGNVTATAALLTAGGWYLPDGSRAELEPYFDANLASYAVRHGSECEQQGKQFRYAYAQDDWVIFITMNRAAAPKLPAKSLLNALILLAAVAVLVLLRINGDVRLLAVKAENAAQGGRDTVKLRSGDELQGIASALSGLSDSIRRQIEERENVERAYRRFVPERALTLLGKRTIEEVDKNSFTSGRMFVMKVWFSFPDYMYSGTADNRVLFNSINEIIERTASIAEQRGGTVFNFAHDGYDVVMRRDSGELVSAAVSMAQEVISLNANRAERDLPEVTFRVALDVGNVIIGIVGDSEQMEMTTISSSFSTVRTLIRLADQLEAGILCTEAIAGGAKGYGSRYLGKASGDAQRVYEIFDADEFDVRKGKAATVKRFSQGVFALYSGDRAQAKHIFLELAHDYPKDGAVRYYLYLADRMETNPETPCELNEGKER
ncbi:MAG: hypothetical protein IKN96_08135 [Oscillibacter sp.]|nr:hypothetical protein [Oscillibacter sp.]